jgi:single-stranded DNA-binding protein
MNRHPENGDTDMSTSTSQITLEGFLGKDRIERWTPDRTETRRFLDPVLDDGESEVEREFTIPGRPYWKLSLATHDPAGKTTWHDCIIWSPENRTPVQNARLARKGDLVKVTGYFEDYTYRKGEELCHGRHLVVEGFHFKRLRSKKPFEIE